MDDIRKIWAETSETLRCESDSSLVLEVLYATKTLEGAIDHDGQSRAQSLTLLHAVRGENNAPSFFNDSNHHSPEVASGSRVHSGGWFIE